MFMKKLKLKSGDIIPIIGFGTYKLTGKEGKEAIEKAIKIGYRHIDTAEAYNNQSEVAKAINTSGVSRNDLFVTSKVWYDNLGYDNVITACEDTLTELETDYLDLYLIHWPNYKIPIEETLRAMTDLKNQGKIRNIGVSNFTVDHLKEAKNVFDGDIVTNQVEFHPYLYQEELYNYCRESDIRITAYSPVARAEVIGDSVIKEIAEKYNKTEIQVSLKWLIQKDIIVIPRSNNPEHIKSNFDVFDFNLSDEDMDRIDFINRNERLVDPQWGEFN